MDALTQDVVSLYRSKSEKTGANRTPLVGLAGSHGAGKSTLGRHLQGEGWHNVDISSNIFQLVLRHNLPPIRHPETGDELAAPPDDYIGLKQRFPYFRYSLSDAVVQLRATTGKDVIDLVLDDQPICGPAVIHSIHSTESAEAVRSMGGLVFWVTRTGVRFSPLFDSPLRPVYSDCDAILWLAHLEDNKR